MSKDPITKDMRREYKVEVIRWIDLNEKDSTDMMNSFYKKCLNSGRKLSDEEGYSGLIIMMCLAYESSMAAMTMQFPETPTETIHIGILRSIESGMFMKDFEDFLQVFPDNGYQMLFNEIDKTMNE